jgi:hypothetical protein
MEALLSTVVGKLVALGGGYLLAAVMILLYVRERRESRDLSLTLIEMAKGQTEASVRTVEVLQSVKETLTELGRRI